MTAKQFENILNSLRVFNFNENTSFVFYFDKLTYAGDLKKVLLKKEKNNCKKLESEYKKDPIIEFKSLTTIDDLIEKILEKVVLAEFKLDAKTKQESFYNSLKEKLSTNLKHSLEELFVEYSDFQDYKIQIQEYNLESFNYWQGVNRLAFLITLETQGKKQIFDLESETVD